MLFKVLVVLVCVVASVSGAPRFTHERARRSTLRSSDLHTRIHDLISEQEHLKASRGQGDDNEENGVSRVNRLRSLSEAEMTSERQKQVQMLSTHLDARTQADLHELAETLDQLLRQTTPQKPRMDRTNTAGEYLGFKFNKKNDVDEEERAVSKELKSEEDTDRKKKEGEEEEEEEEEEGGEEELQAIYSMVLKLYNQQHQKALKEKEEAEEEEAGEEEEPAPEKKASMPYRQLSTGAQRASRPDYVVDEGTFGEFVDTDTEEVVRPTAQSARYTEQLRRKVLNAIESRLVQDLRDAEQVGITVDDIIHDIQGKAKKKEYLSHIEDQLNRLASRD